MALDELDKAQDGDGARDDAAKDEKTRDDKAKDDKDRVVPGPEVEEFANALDSCLAPGLSVAEKRARILDLPRKYHSNAIRRLVQRKKPKGGRDGQGQVDAEAADAVAVVTDPADLAEIQQLEKEAQTWDLVRRLLPLRYPEHGAFAQEPTTAKAASLDHFMETEPTVRERRAVLQWLQTNAASGPDIDELAHDLQQNADRGDVIAHGWLHTRSKIKLRKSMTAWPHLLERQSPNMATSHANSDGSPLVTHLDPDAATRQSRKLEAQDDYFERAIWLGCFEHLRRGSTLATIREWCQERTEMWRAVSMSGLLLPADGRESPAEVPAASLALWRRMSLSLTRNGGADDYERAVYGLLSGDIASVEKVARCWDDYMFANCNAVLRSQIDGFVLGQCPAEVASSLAQSFASFDAIKLHGGLDGLERRLIVSLESQESTREEALEPNKALQASLIANDIDRHLYEQAVMLSEEANKDERSPIVPWMAYDVTNIVGSKFFGLKQHDGLRIVTHVYVLLALLRHFDELQGGRSSTSRAARDAAQWQRGQENIVAAYTGYLEKARLQELVPLYCSVLQGPRQLEVLGWNMIHEQQPEKRVAQLKLMKRAGIDVLSFVETLAKLVFGDLKDDGDGGTAAAAAAASQPFSILLEATPSARRGRGIKADFFGSDEETTTKDEHVIRSLEWLVQVQVAWPEAFRIGVQAYKNFFKRAHLPSIRKLMERVQFDAVMQNVTDEDTLDLATFDDVAYWEGRLEQSGITTASAHEVMMDARNYRELECMAKALDSLETIGSLGGLAAEAPANEAKFWSGVRDAVAVMKERMAPLLHGWLVAGIQGGDEELARLRQSHLPETILAYVSGLHFAGTGLSRDHLLEAMDLATLVAERNADVGAAFVAGGRMTELVEAFAACAKALAVATGERRATTGSSKKLRERGWARDLWAVKGG